MLPSETRPRRPLTRVNQSIAARMSSPPLVSLRQTVQELLPTCVRCRRLRRKCDTQLPNCRLCEKAGVECIFNDHALNQPLPRAYVQSLLTRFENLKAAKQSLENSSSQFSMDITQDNTSPKTKEDNTFGSENQSSSATTTVDNDTQHSSSIRPRAESFDKHFVNPNTSGTSRFFGSSSVFTLSLYVLHHAVRKCLLSEEQAVSRRKSYVDPPSPIKERNSLHKDSSGTIRSYCSLYLTSSNVLYGIVDESTAEADIEVYLSFRENHPVDPKELHGIEAHAYFRVGMMCAIACATKARYKPELATKSLAYYENVLPCVEEVTSEASPASLQALLLLTVFCLFWPRKGEIWKLLDYACRLSVELGYHTEQPIDFETNEQKRLRRSAFWGLYAIERIVGQLFGRGSDLPEPIITTEYPCVLTTVDGVDQVSLQPMSIGHHYRLVYLRSEIFRDMYMPALGKEFDLSWYKECYTLLSNWRQELKVSESKVGVATATCDVGYDSTMCFIFQPLMLRAINATETPSTDPIHITAVPQDNYWSACGLVRSYEKIIRAPEDSPLGAYPMTWMSAHYIYLAGLTLMTHALLAIDGRVTTLKRMSELGSESDTEAIDFSDLFEVSHSCLIILSWCAERWPGMEGMMDVYKKLADKVIPAMFRKGLL